MTRRKPTNDYSLRGLQAALGVPRRVLTGLIEGGFVEPRRGRRNEFRFSFQDVVLLRTAFHLRTANIAAHKIVRSLAKLKAALPEELPLTGIRVTAVGSAVVVKKGPSQWEADTGQFLLDFEVAPINGEVAFLDNAPTSVKALQTQVEEWYALAEQLEESDPVGAEVAYRKVLELSPAPPYEAYVNLGALLCAGEGRCEEALSLFDEALQLAPANYILHFNRAVVLEELGRIEEAVQSYGQSLELNPQHDDAVYNLARLREIQGDEQAFVRHVSAFRRTGV